MNTRAVPWLVALLLLLQATSVMAREVRPAGHVIVAGSGVKAKAKNGKIRVLKRRAPLFEGDTVITGKSSAQIRFADGSLTSLRPGTTFSIESFRWDGEENGSERGIFSLIRGGLNTISGAIGKSNRRNYAMRTPVATIGIRGTHYSLRYCSGDCPLEKDSPPRGLFGSVIAGRINVGNQGGDTLFGPDSFFFVATKSIVPHRLETPPTFMLKTGKIKGPAQVKHRVNKIKESVKGSRWDSGNIESRFNSGNINLDAEVSRFNDQGVELNRDAVGTEDTIRTAPTTIKPSEIKRIPRQIIKRYYTR